MHHGDTADDAKWSNEFIITIDSADFVASVEKRLETCVTTYCTFLHEDRPVVTKVVGRKSIAEDTGKF